MQHDVQQGHVDPSPLVPARLPGDNAMKVTIDGDRLQVTANVDLKGARRLLKALKANMALLEDDDEDHEDGDVDDSV